MKDPSGNAVLLLTSLFARPLMELPLRPKQILLWDNNNKRKKIAPVNSLTLWLL